MTGAVVLGNWHCQYNTAVPVAYASAVAYATGGIVGSAVADASAVAAAEAFVASAAASVSVFVASAVAAASPDEGCGSATFAASADVGHQPSYSCVLADLKSENHTAMHKMNLYFTTVHTYRVSTTDHLGYPEEQGSELRVRLKAS